jgi:hypothetical protein
MTRRPKALLWTVVLLLSTVRAGLGAESVAMRTIEGEVVSISRHKGEGQFEVVMAQVAASGPEHSLTEILLAPDTVCQQIGFEVHVGDRLRARVFVESAGPARVQKIQNFTSGTMVRMRTLHRIPLWSATGTWQGGPIQNARGPHRHRGNRGPREPAR